MEPSYSKYQLWSPPTLDLSLDSFSNDLIQEFDKTRSNIDTGVKTQEKITLQEENANEETETIASSVVAANTMDSGGGGNQNITSLSPVPSSVTLPSSERETSLQEEEDSSSTSNLFRKSSTFLKKKLSQNSGSNKKDENGSISTTPEEITNIVSRQYPPKPLQYSPVIEPPSNNVSASTTQADLSRNSREAESSVTAAISNKSRSIKRTSEPISVVHSSNAATSIAAAATTTPTPKRRSFFSLRFC